MEVKRTLAGFASSGQRRKLPGPLGRVVHGFAALIAIAVVYTTTIVFVDLFAMTIVFLAAMLALVFLTVGATPDSPTDRPSAVDWLFALTALAVGAYFLIESERIITRITLLHPLTGLDMVFAPALLILTLEATRRTVGMGLTTIVAIFLAYNLWGHWLPGKLSHGEPPSHRVPGSIAAGMAAVGRGIQLLRVHDVAATRQAIAIWEAIRGQFI